MQKQIILIAFLLLGALSLLAQNEPKKVTNTFALQKVTVVQAPGKVMTDATVVVKDGLIHAVGKNVEIPFDAKIVKADSMIVYPGFISGAAHIGIPKVEKKEEGRRRYDPDVKDPGNPPNDKAGIQPERQVRDLLKADDNAIEGMRKLGFTTAQTMPDGKMLPGQASIVLLAGASANDMILMDNTALFFQFKGASGVAPATVIGVMSKLRDLYKQAEQAKTHRATFVKNPSGMKRPTSDPILEAFYPVIDGDKALMVKANTSRDISRAMALQKDLGYNMILTDVKQGWNYLDQMRGQQVLLSLDLPKAKESKSKKKEDEAQEEEKSKSMADKEMEALEMRRGESMKQYENQAKMLAEKGVAFGFSTLDAKAKDIKANFKRMMDAGLTEDQMLAALTTTPAKMLGIDKVTGTVAEGKIANLVVTDAPYFEEQSNVRYVFVDGQLFEYEAKAKKKKKKEGKEGDATEAPADVAGVWTYEMSVPGQELEGTLTIKKSDEELSVFMSDPSGSGEEEEIEDAVLEGDVMTFSMDVEQGGASMNIEFELTFDGESYEGTMSVGSFGSFDVEGVRTSKPD
ncbi:MAG: amidohydrolase family protein [Bacteroidota bacterium]